MLKPTKFIFLPLFLIALSFLSACTIKFGGGSFHPNVGVSEYDHSCAYSADEGGSFIPSQNSKLETTYFHKDFDRSHLEAVYGASMRQTAQYIQQVLHVDVTQGSLSGGRCKPMAFLPTPGQQAQERWSAISSNMGGFTLLGLYLSKYDISSAQDGTIVVAPDSDRWTITHEMLHHLFELGRENQNNFIDNSSLKNKLKELQKYCSSNYCSQADELANMQETMKYTDLLLVRYTLEEMTVEGTMSKAFHNGLFSYMPDGSHNSISYISLSGRRAEKIYGSAINALYSMTSKSDTPDEKSQALITLFSNRIDEIHSIENEIEAIDGYPSTGYSQNNFRPLIGIKAESKQYLSIQQTETDPEIEKILKSVDNRLKKYQ